MVFFFLALMLLYVSKCFFLCLLAGTDTESCFTDDVMNPTSSSNSNMQWWSHLVTNDNIDRIEHSGKCVLLIDILRKCKLIGDKLLVFSQSLTSLDLIEEFLAIEDLRNREKNAVNEVNTFFLSLFQPI